jgi:glycerophosphoryl diester phosphodiesterase
MLTWVANHPVHQNPPSPFEAPPTSGAAMQPIEIIAHRGASRERPENTVAAFTRAAELGAGGIELDVHLSADGVLMVHHDPFPHDPPLPGLAHRGIGSLTVDEIGAFRVLGEPIPTLAQVLDAVGDHLRVYCELKGPGTSAEAVRLLGKRGDAAAVHAFDHRQIAVARRLAPGLARGVLEASYHTVPTDSMASVDARDLWQAADLIDRDLVEAVHVRGGRVVAWTVDDPAMMRHLAALRVDALCTNDVALCRSTLGR